jgi:hypothetical protein
VHIPNEFTACFAVASVEVAETERTRQRDEPAGSREQTPVAIRKPTDSAGAPGIPRSVPTDKTTRPIIPQVDFQELLDTLLGDPNQTLRKKTLLGQALVTDGKQLAAAYAHGKSKECCLHACHVYFLLL